MQTNELKSNIFLQASISEYDTCLGELSKKIIAVYGTDGDKVSHTVQRGKGLSIKTVYFDEDYGSKTTLFCPWVKEWGDITPDNEHYKAINELVDNYDGEVDSIDLIIKNR